MTTSTTVFPSAISAASEASLTPLSTHAFHLYFLIIHTYHMNQIRQWIDEGRITDAIELLNDYLATHPDSDEALYLRGRAHRKAGRIREAINDYLASAAIRPDGPAARAYRMEIEIMDFYDRNLYNP